MELKNYQEKVLEDLRIYLNLLSRNKNLSQIWNEYKAKKASDEIYGKYNDEKTLNIARICYKVPTGGGKTIEWIKKASLLVNKNFKFYLVFQTKEKGSGYYNADEFIEILKDL